jgi:glycosyltransferase involved in cell wall biosynthesis
LHEPNWDSVLWLKKEIWPLIRIQIPKASLHIYGAYPSHKVFQLHAPNDGFYINGRANDVGEVMKKARVCLAPLRFGAGLKGKLADAMMFGAPNVTTSIGAEAMKKKLSWSGMIAETPEEISKAAVKLYTDETLWNKSQQNGIKIINTFFSKSELKNKLAKKIAHIQTNLAAHRNANFTGAMLMQHTVLSSRYMALWIEAKNNK